MSDDAISARVTREVGILAGRLAALLDHALPGSSASTLADGRGFLQAAFAAVADGLPLAEFAGSAVHRPAPDARHPIDHLAHGLALDDAALDLVLLAGLPEEHEGYAALLRGLHPRGEPWLPVGLAAQLLYPSNAERLQLRRALEGGPFVRCGVLRLTGDGPFFERSILLAESLWPALHGIDALPERLDRFDADGGTAALEVWLAQPAARRAAKAIATGLRCTVLLSGDGDEALHWRGCALVRQAGATPLAFALPANIDPATQRLAQAHALVRGATPVLRTIASDPPSTAPAVFADFPGTVVLCAPAGSAAIRPGAPLLPLDAGTAVAASRRAMWREAVPRLAGDAAHLAARFPVDPWVAAQVARDVNAVARIEQRTVTADDLAASLRARAGLQLGGAVKLVHPVATWDDLILSADRRRQLEEAVDRLAQQATVLDDWGFLAGRTGGRGVRMLFSGPPGTGKTLSAEVMASALGADLLVVDLSRVVSKWIGETEKNLSAVFDSAERAQAVLFFDEADALFGRRTEVSDAHDRYANLETAYLLQRLERFDGLAVLATNLRQNLDPAFLRRLEFAIDFDEPDRDSRHALWRGHIPDGAPLDRDVNLQELAALYPVVGGFIRNAAVAAAFLAAADGLPIGRQHLVRAVRREYAKAGRAFPGAPHGLNP
jgi:hypothetical protein